MNRKVAILIAIVLLGLAVRVYGAVQFPFEQDELYTIDEATNLFDTKLQPGIQARPAFFLMEHPVVAVSTEPLAIRMLPLVCGILGLWVTWGLARRVMDQNGALITVFLAALSPWHMYASAFARYYSLIYLLAALVYWRLPIAYDTNRPRDYLYVLLPLLLGAWTHPSFVFPVAGAGLAMMAVTRTGSFQWRWPTRTGWLTLWIPFVVLSGVILAIIRSIHEATTVANGGDRGLMATIRLLPAMIDWMTPIVFGAACMGAIALVTSREAERRRLGWMTIVGGLTMFVALFGLSFKTAIYADYGMAALPLLIVAAGAAVQWIAESVAESRRAGARAIVTGLIVLGMLPSAVSYLLDGMRFDYRPAFARIARDGANDAVLAWPYIVQRAYAPQFRSYELLPSRQRLDSLLTRERDVWAVVSVKRYGIVGDDAGEMQAWLGDHCRAVDSYQRPRFDYRMYRVDLWRCRAGSSSEPFGAVTP